MKEKVFGAIGLVALIIGVLAATLPDPYTSYNDNLVVRTNATVRNALKFGTFTNEWSTSSGTNLTVSGATYPSFVQATNTLGVTTTGLAVMQAADKAAGRAAIGIGPSDTVAIDTLNVGTLGLTNPPVLPVFTVSTLPASGSGGLAWCSDVLTPWGSGGPVYFDGSAWRNIASKITAKSDVPGFLSEALRVGWSGTTPILMCRFADWIRSDATMDLSGGSFVSGTGASASALENFTSPEVPFGVGFGTGSATNGSSQTFGAPGTFQTGQVVIQAVSASIPTIPDGTDNFYVFHGMSSGVPAVSAESAGFLYDPYDGLGYGTTGSQTNNWLCLTRSGSANTLVDSGIAVSATAWHRFAMVYQTTNVIFYIDSAPVATNTTHIPYNALFSNVNMIKKFQGTTSRFLAVDWTYFGIRYASPRTLF